MRGEFNEGYPPLSKWRRQSMWLRHRDRKMFQKKKEGEREREREKLWRVSGPKACVRCVRLHHGKNKKSKNMHVRWRI